MVFKPLLEPSLSSVQVQERVAGGGWGAIHGSDSKARGRQGQALRCCSGVSRTQHRLGRGAFAGQV